jgi:tripartite-type tricarboxylate transporter receptor subunit TctC
MNLLARLVPPLVASLALIGGAQAQTFPSGPVRIIVPLAAGGIADVAARALVDRLGPMWGQPITIENRTGAGTNLGAEAVARSTPDGHTLMVTTEGTVVVNPFLYTKLNYDPLKDLAPVSGVGIVHQMLIAHPSLPVKSVGELVALAKRDPGAISYGSFGIGTSGHLNMETLMAQAGIKLTPVHYRGAAPALTDVIGGHVKLCIISITLSQGPIRAGQVNALGVGSDKRVASFPNVPTISESGVPGYQAVTWIGVFAPSATPGAAVEKINGDVQRVLATADFKAKFLDPQQLEPISGDAKAFAAFIKSEAESWSKVIKAAGIKMD